MSRAASRPSLLIALMGMMRIGKVMPRFFGPVYFQYHLIDWQAGGPNAAGKTLGLS